jgi:hypothetical protein
MVKLKLIHINIININIIIIMIVKQPLGVAFPNRTTQQIIKSLVVVRRDRAHVVVGGIGAPHRATRVQIRHQLLDVARRRRRAGQRPAEICVRLAPIEPELACRVVVVG